jgi:DNA polymerase zeta
LNFRLSAPSQGERLPNPDEDQLLAAFYSIQGQHGHEDAVVKYGAVATRAFGLCHSVQTAFNADVVSDELELLNTLTDVILSIDPDIVTGWQIQSASWGYVNLRALHYG